MTFLWAGNCDSVKVVKKSVKLGAKAHKMAQNFKTSYLGLGINFWDTFRAQKHCLVIGYLMGNFFFEFQPNLCLSQLLKEGTHQGIGQFCHAFFQTPITLAWSGHSAQNYCLSRQGGVTFHRIYFGMLPTM